MRHGSRRLTEAVATAFRDSRQNPQLSVEPRSASVPADEVAHHHFPPLNAARASFLDAWEEVRTQQGQVHTQAEQLAAALHTQLQRMQRSHTQHGQAREALNMHLPQLLSGVQGCLGASEALLPQLLQVQQQLQDAQVALKQWHLSQRVSLRSSGADSTQQQGLEPGAAPAAVSKADGAAGAAASAVAQGGIAEKGGDSTAAETQTATQATEAGGPSHGNDGVGLLEPAETGGANSQAELAATDDAQAPSAPPSAAQAEATDDAQAPSAPPSAAQAEATDDAQAPSSPPSAAQAEATEPGAGGKRKKKRKGGKR